MYLYGALAGFVLGVFISSVAVLGYSFSIALVACAGALLFLGVIHSEKQRKVFLLFAIFILSVGLGALRLTVSLNDPDDTLFHLVDTEVTLVVQVTEEPQTRDSYQRIVGNIVDENGDSLDGVLISADFFPVYNYGDVLEVTGLLQMPEQFMTQEGRMFDYPAYLDKDGIHFQLFHPQTARIESGNGNIIKRSLYIIKHQFLSSITSILTEPHASLLGGLIVGAQESLGKELLDDFRTVGIIHIVVLSGYNVTIVAEAIQRVFSRFFSRLPKLLLGGLVIVLFALMTGGSATTVRASIMALLVLLSRGTNREYDVVRALFLAGFLMILHNPKILVFDASFQLSFIATLGLLYIAPLLQEKMPALGGSQLIEFATATIATQIMVLPLLLYMTGEISIVALPVNILILWLTPLTMLFGFITGVAGMISPILALPFSLVSYFFLEYMLRVVDIFSALPFASLHIGFLSPSQIIFIYAILFSLLTLFAKKKKTMGLPTSFPVSL